MSGVYLEKKLDFTSALKLCKEPYKIKYIHDDYSENAFEMWSSVNYKSLQGKENGSLEVTEC